MHNDRFVECNISEIGKAMRRPIKMMSLFSELDYLAIVRLIDPIQWRIHRR